MIHQPLGALGFISVAMFIFAMAIILIGARMLYERRLRGLAFIALGIAIAPGAIFLFQTIPAGNIGIDEKGDWYEKGQHLSFEKIQMVSLSGSIPLWKESLELRYTLTPEEVISLESGANFQNRLRASYVYSIDEGWNAKMDKTQYAPSRDIDISHLQLVVTPHSSFSSG